MIGEAVKAIEGVFDAASEMIDRLGSARKLRVIDHSTGEARVAREVIIQSAGGVIPLMPGSSYIGANLSLGEMVMTREQARHELGMWDFVGGFPRIPEAKPVEPLRCEYCGQAIIRGKSCKGCGHPS